MTELNFDPAQPLQAVPNPCPHGTAWEDTTMECAACAAEWEALWGTSTPHLAATPAVANTIDALQALGDAPVPAGTAVVLPDGEGDTIVTAAPEPLEPEPDQSVAMRNRLWKQFMDEQRDRRYNLQQQVEACRLTAEEAEQAYNTYLANGGALQLAMQAAKQELVSHRRALHNFRLKDGFSQWLREKGFDPEEVG